MACLVRDWVPQSELLRSGTIERVNLVRGDICDRDTLERAIGEYETDAVIHLAAQAIVGIANRNPISTFESNIQRHLDRARSLPALAGCAFDCDRIFRQGVWRAGEASLHGRHAAGGTPSV